MNVTPEVVGKMRFGPLIDITDPCYDKDVWCRLNDVEIKEGTYECIAYRGSFVGENYTRTFSMSIVHESVNEEIEELLEPKYLGSIGVDAGLAGFFNNKKDYSNDEWFAFCDELRRIEQEDEPRYMMDDGFFTDTGFGDGSYGVEAWEYEGEIVVLTIEFIGSDDDDDEYDENDFWNDITG